MCRTLYPNSGGEYPLTNLLLDPVYVTCRMLTCYKPLLHWTTRTSLIALTKGVPLKKIIVLVLLFPVLILGACPMSRLCLLLSVPYRNNPLRNICRCPG